jgi:serine/threonine-protein kinase
MILRDGSVKVADFGIARFANKQSTLTQEALGSVHYISPEQARGSHIDARSDLYSVGVVLYEMLTERLPFEGESAVSVALQHISSLPLSPREINAEIPEALEIIILKAMAPKLTRRYESAEEMLRDLEEFRKNPAISFEYDINELKTAADEDIDEPTRSLPGGTKGKGIGLDARTAAEERRRIRKEMLDEQNHKTRKSGNWIATLSAVLGVLAFIAVLGFVIISMIDGLFSNDQVELVEIPDLRFEEFISIEALNERFPLLRFFVEREYSSEHDENIIFDQEPLPFRHLPEGTEVYITVSTGREPVIMTNLTGMSLETAQIWLLQNGLRYSQTENRSEKSDTVPRNHVISSEPGENEVVYRGDLVVLVYSLGKEDVMVTMPSLLGETEQRARDLLSQHNLILGEPVEYEVYDFPEGEVFWQSAAPGDEFLENTEIFIKVSLGLPVIDDPSPTPPEPTPPEPTHPDPTPPDPTPTAELPYTFHQRIAIPEGIVGMTTLTIEQNGARYFEQQISADDGFFVVEIRGVSEDIFTFKFDDVVHYSQSVAAMLQQQQ